MEGDPHAFFVGLGSYIRAICHRLNVSVGNLKQTSAYDKMKQTEVNTRRNLNKAGLLGLRCPLAYIAWTI